MRPTPLLPVIAMLLTLEGIAAPAQAELVFGTIHGTVTETGSGVPGVSVGSPVTGNYRYDTAVLVNNPFFGPVNPLSDFALSIGSNPYTFGLSDLDFFFFGSAPFRIPDFATPTVDWLSLHFTQASLESFMGTTGIGPSNDLLGNLPQTLKTGLVNDPAHTLTFTFIAAVPEPGSLALLAGMGSTGVILLHRRRYRRRA